MSDLLNRNNGKSDNNLINVLSFTMNKVKEMADANTVLGEKIVVDGVVVIPVSKVSAGFAGGGADLMDASKKKKSQPAGTGGNVTVTPMSFLVIDGKDVKLINVNPDEKKSTFSEIVSSVVDKIKSSKKQKK